MYTFLGWQCITMVLLIIMLSMKRSKNIMKGKYQGRIPKSHIMILKGVWYSTIFLPGILSITKNSLYWRILLLGMLFLYWQYMIRNIEFYGGSKKKWACKGIIWNWLRSRGNVKCKWTNINQKKQYIFVGHPHGVLPLYSISGFIGDGDDSLINLYPEIDLRILVASATFYLPIYGNYILGIGGIDASSISMKYALKNGSSILLYPGGGEEALYTNYKEDVIILKSKKGFIRLAIEEGVAIVPTLGFNENDAYEQKNFENDGAKNLQQGLLSRLGMTIPYLKNIIPKKSNFHIITSDPIEVPHENPASPELVEIYHKKYINELISLYEKYGHIYNSYKKRILRII